MLTEIQSVLPDALRCPFPEPISGASGMDGRSSEPVRSTSALTPTIPSVPSAKHSRALPFAKASRSVSPINGLKEVGERASGRMGGFSESELYK